MGRKGQQKKAKGSTGKKKGETEKKRLYNKIGHILGVSAEKILAYLS